MIRFADWLGHWSVDVYLLGSVLLILALIANAMLRQPVHRLAVVKSLLVGLSLLAGLSAVPGWSVLHLLAPKTAPVTAFQVAPLTISPHDFSRNLSGPSQLMTPLPIIAPVQKPTAVSLASTDIWSIAGLTVLIGALAVLIWLAVGWAAARNLRRQSKAAPSQIQKLLQDLARSNITRKNTPTPQLFLS
jgi:hypothetical protein